MQLKILGGQLKGRNIKTPNIPSTRPITSLLRKSIFDSLQFSIEGTRILDLFAGSGAIGLEALSRGSTFACFIDNNPLAINCIRENLEALTLKNSAWVIQKDAFTYLEEYDREPFDILFIDPPYPIGLEGYTRLLHLLSTSKALTLESRILLEAPSQIGKSLTPLITSLFTIKKERKTSTTILFHL
jgi:16S rRNA (guanine966-N2)-methyltransferase